MHYYFFWDEDVSNAAPKATRAEGGRARHVPLHGAALCQGRRTAKPSNYTNDHRWGALHYVKYSSEVVCHTIIRNARNFGQKFSQNWKLFSPPVNKENKMERTKRGEGMEKKGILNP